MTKLTVRKSQDETFKQKVQYLVLGALGFVLLSPLVGFLGTYLTVSVMQLLHIA